MTEHADELLGKLASANPANVNDMPSATSPAAQAILHQAMLQQCMPEQTGTGATPDGRFVSADSDGFGPPPAHVTHLDEGRRRVPARGRRSLAMVGTAAAAVVLLVAGVTMFLPGSTEPALAAVHSAATTTAQAQTGRITTTFTLTGDDGQIDHTISGRADAAFERDNLSFTVDAGQLAELRSDGDLVVEGRLIDGVLYGNEGSDQWYSVDADNFLTAGIVGTIDPRSVLTTVQDLVEAQEIGSTRIDGIETTHYQSTVDLAEQSLSDAGWLAGLNGIDVAVEGQLVIDLYVDLDGQLRQLDISGEATEPGGSESARFDLSTRFHDLGGDISITAPDPATVVDLTDQLSSALSGSLSGELGGD